MTHNINVTQPHIDAGLRRDPLSCPLALALMQHFGRPVNVAKTFFWFDDDESQVNLPTIAIKFQNDFDRGYRTLQPFNFPITEHSTCYYCK